MTKVPAWGAPAARAPLVPMTIERREPGPREVALDVLWCGICHSDLHQVRDEWGGATFPLVPGHEIVGRVAARGAGVTRFREGDLAGVGCFVDSCRACAECRAGREMFCETGASWTYNGLEQDKRTRTYGGYSTRIVLDERYALRIPEGMDPAGAAPLLCAGITTWSPLRAHGCREGARVGVVGLGGLGHMAVKLAASLGAEVTVLSTSREKEKDAARLGARAFVDTREAGALDALEGRLDLLVDTVSAPHDLNKLLATLRPLGAMVLVGLPPEDARLDAGMLVNGNKRLAGSNIGGIAETQEMLDHCGRHGIVADVERIPVQRVNEAYERMLRGDVRYRFVIDAASLR